MRQPARVGLTAAAIVAGQVAMAAACGGRADPAAAWLALFQFDGGWFRGVLEHGYAFPPEPTRDDPGNVVFFPAYPLAARGLAAATGLPADAALLATAQLAAFGFWVYVLLLFRRWRVPPAATAGCVGLVAGHPAAFFLVSSYSESTLLMAFAGYVYWCGRGGRAAAALAALHGFAMTAARLVGIVAAAYPVLLAWARRGSLRAYAAAGAVAAAAALGAAAFVAYLRVAFGRWDALTAAQAAGWDVRPDPWALVREKTWAGLSTADPLRVWIDAAAVDRLYVPLTAAQGLLMLGLELAARRGGRPTRWRERVPLYLCAAALFAVPVTSHAGRGLSSMTRFALGWEVPLIFALGHLFADRPDWAARRWVRGAVFAPVAWSVSVQVTLADKYTHGVFVG